MPPKYHRVFNGGSMVMRPIPMKTIVKKQNGGQLTVAVPDIPSKDQEIKDKKQRKAILAHELMKGLD